MSNTPNHSRPSRLPHLFLAFSIFVAVSALSLLLLKSCDRKVKSAGVSASPEPESKQIPIQSLDMPAKEEPVETLPEILNSATEPVLSGDVVADLAKALENGDLEAIMKLVGNAHADPISSEHLKQLAEQNAVSKIRPLVRQVGEIAGQDTMRWSLQLSGQKSLLLDLKRKNGTWVLERYSIPQEGTSASSPVDALSVADRFLQSVLRQDFETAKHDVLPDSITDAKIAGLCILFEEGNYTLPANRPMRSVLSRKGLAGYLVAVANADDTTAAQIGITLRQAEDRSWKIAEINLDGLLSDYAAKFAQGDIYYSPLVRNPAGGDTIALYFDFDSGEIDPRATRQLEIVAMVLRADPNRKIHISGHTDALGSDPYNQSLSNQRADAVRNALVGCGVPSSQIVMSALGSSQPRRPNVTESGEDNPSGRRVNRRAEIYLDF